MSLKAPVGPWLRLDSDIWPWFYNPLMDGLIHIMGKEYQFYPRQTPIRRQNCFSSDSRSISYLPKLLYKASVQWSRNRIWLIDTGEFDTRVTALQSLSPYEHNAAPIPINTWCFDYLTIPTANGPQSTTAGLKTRNNYSH
jgi:hypothetical protein